MPILRPLSDINTEEKKWYSDLTGYNIDDLEEHYCPMLNLDIGNPTVWSYLLKQGFDLFGLIEAGLALDKTKINQKAQ